MQLITQRLEYLHAFEKCLDVISLNASEMQKLQTCVCFTHPQHKMLKWLCICGNEATSDSYHGSGVKLILLVATA